MAEPRTEALRETFEALWCQHQVPLVRYCNGFTEDVGEAEEVRQQVGLLAWEHFSCLRDHKVFGAWVRAITRRELVRRARDRQADRERQVSLPSGDLPPPGGSRGCLGIR